MIFSATTWRCQSNLYVIFSAVEILKESAKLLELATQQSLQRAFIWKILCRWHSSDIHVHMQQLQDNVAAFTQRNCLQFSTRLKSIASDKNLDCLIHAGSGACVTLWPHCQPKQKWKQLKQRFQNVKFKTALQLQTKTKVIDQRQEFLQRKLKTKLSRKKTTT